MNLEEVQIKNLRCLLDKKIKFSPNTNIIYGKNGSGKTSILEGIHTLCYSKSFRPNIKNNIITKNKNTMFVKGFFLTKENKKIEIKHGRVGCEKKITINRKKIQKTSEVVGLIPCVVLSPEDIDIVSGPNTNKIKYIDKILSTTNNKYLKTLINLKKTLKQRNKLLKEQHTKKELEVWSEKLATQSTKIWEDRAKFFEKYQSEIQQEYNNINVGGEIKIIYKTQTNTTVDGYIKKAKENYLKDVKTKQTNTGPHKDVLEIFWDNKNMRTQASQGEKKLLLIILKKTEALYLYKKTNTQPIVLLDDLFAKLDSKKCFDTLSLFYNNFQTIITSTDNTVEPLIEKLNINPIYLKMEKPCFEA